MERSNKLKQPGPAAARALAGAVLALLLAACAGTQTRPDAVVAERAQARWDALLAGDYDTAYALYSPGYRSSISRTDFEIQYRLRKVRWKTAEYQSHECTDSACTVRFMMTYTVNSPVPGIKKYTGRSRVEESWVNTRGNWWYLPEKS
ncbi:MAG: hypothetical protein RQ826_08900 [Xanthomonadales bacterium]|nr:hypothetical protein [Xanthomonadales bacterium]